ncbi:MAG: efflux RND transporter periplasmic adaptor subunit [Bacteroidetes bacterium]|nr:MAG: efflux RND transporter periplasmic adaptor subunit [Bacteroidota bacterium]TAG89698.1 MAG: efflux RND transporter periplasmic adaptor subunit [Bacteroidota bacterium]
MKTKLFYILYVFLALVSCQNTKKETQTNHQDEHKHAENEIELTDAQIKTIGLEIGGFEQSNIGEVIKVTGMVDVPVEGRAAVNPPVEGFLKKTEIMVGQFVTQGQILTSLEHQNYIILQENYLTTKNEVDYLLKEFERQKELSAENINAKKTFQRIETDLSIQQTKKASLEMQLRILGIEPTQISAKNLQRYVFIRAPIEGYVKKVSAVAGRFVNTQETLFEIVSNTHKHIELQVFEKDILKVKKGQKVVFYSPNSPDDVHTGEVFLIGQAIDLQQKTVNVHVHFSDEQSEKNFLEGMYIEAKILLSEQKQETIAEDAVIRDGENSFVFIQTKKNHYKKIAIKIKNENDKQISFEWAENMPNTPKIVKKGAYYLNAQMNVGQEEGHAH